MAVEIQLPNGQPLLYSTVRSLPVLQKRNVRLIGLQTTVDHKEGATVRLLLQEVSKAEPLQPDFQMSLCEAIFDGEMDDVRLLTISPELTNKTQEKFPFPPLYVAAEQGNVPIVKLVLGVEGTDVHQTVAERFTALHVAAYNGHSDVVDTLLQMGSAVWPNDLSSTTSKIATTVSDNGDITSQMADQRWTKADLATALTLAAKRGHLDVTRSLLDGGADVNGQEYTTSPVCEAASGGHLDVCRLLLDQGADMYRVSIYGDTALGLAAQNGHRKVVALLLQRGCTTLCAFPRVHGPFGFIEIKNPLVQAAANGQMDIVTMLLDSGAPIDQEGATDHTVLQVAAKKGHNGVVKLLLDSGADVNRTNRNGFDALCFASQNGHKEIVNMLLKGGATFQHTVRNRPNVVNPVVVATANGYESVVRVLLDGGAPIDGEDYYGCTALHLAAQNGHTGLVKLLLDRGAKVNHVSSNRFTALCWASQNGQQEVAALLLERGCSPSRTLIFFASPLTLAACNNHLAIVKMLLDKGAPINECDVNGNTALQLAALEGHSEVVQLLKDRGAKVDCVAPIKNYKKQTMMTHPLIQGCTVGAPLHKRTHIENLSYDNWMALHATVAKGRVSKMAQLLKGVVNRAKFWTRKPYLINTAVALGPMDMVAFLLKQGCPANETDVSQEPPLIVAVRKRRVEMVVTLLRGGANVEVTWNGQTALHHAVCKRHCVVVEKLLNHGADIDRVTTNVDLKKKRVTGSALHIALQNGHEEMVALLLGRGCTVRNIFGCPTQPLYYAAAIGNSNNVRALLSSKARVDDCVATNYGRLTALHAAVVNKRVGAMEALFEGLTDRAKIWTWKPYLINWAVMTGSLDMVTLLLRMGCPPNRTDLLQEPPLTVAARIGNVDITAKLLQSGARIRDTWKGITALHYAAQEGHRTVALLLLDYGADVDAVGESFVTPLYLANAHHHQQVAQLLLDRGASPGNVEWWKPSRFFQIVGSHLNQAFNNTGSVVPNPKDSRVQTKGTSYHGIQTLKPPELKGDTGK